MPSYDCDFDQSPADAAGPLQLVIIDDDEITSTLQKHLVTRLPRYKNNEK
jgi:hypothetical protein